METHTPTKGGNCCEKMTEALRLNDEAAYAPTTGIKLTDDHRRAVSASIKYVMVNRCPFCNAARPIRNDKSSRA